MDRADAWGRAGHWDRALAEYQRANRLDPDAPGAIRGIAASSAMIAEAHIAGARRSLAAGDFDGAYSKALAARKARPDLEIIELTLEAITIRLLAEARDMSAAGHFGDALDLLDIIRQRVPDRAGAARDLTEGSRLAWAASLRVQAQQDEAADHPGPALVRYAMAASLSDNPDDARARDRLRAALLKDQSFKIALSIKGDPPRAAAAADLIRQITLHKLRALQLVDTPADPGAALTLALGPPQCQQDSTVEVANHRYVSGTRQLANPDWVRLRQEVEAIERDLLRLEQSADRDLDDLERAEDERDRAAREGRPDLDRLQREVEDRRQKVRQSRAERQRTRQTLLRCHEDLGRLSPFVDEDVLSDFSYEVRAWVRTCAVPWEALLADHDGRRAQPLRSEQRASTADRSHAAHVRFQIPEDPLAFSQRDADLIRAADRAIVETAAGLLLDRFRDHRAAIVARAQAVDQTDPAEATRLLILAYLMEPDDGRGGIDALLQARFDFLDPRVLAR